MVHQARLSLPGSGAGLIAIVLVTLALLSTTANAQDDAPLTIEADDILEWNQTDGIYTAKGNAVAIQGTTEIRGNLLIATYDPEGETRDIETVTATGKVDYRDDNSRATGSKIIYRIADRDYRVEGPEAVVSGPRGTITADTLIDLDTREDKTQKMTATGSAVYRDDTGRVFAGEILHAYFDAAGALTALDAEGDVVVTNATGREATGDAATYNAASDSATVTGNVEITDGGSIIRGDRAEIDLESGDSRMLSSGSGGRVSGVLKSN